MIVHVDFIFVKYVSHSIQTIEEESSLLLCMCKFKIFNLNRA